MNPTSYDFTQKKIRKKEVRSEKISVKTPEEFADAPTLRITSISLNYPTVSPPIPETQIIQKTKCRKGSILSFSSFSMI